MRVASRVREAGLPVGVVGRITSAEQAESVLTTGPADVISLARPLLTNPHRPSIRAHELRAPSAAALAPPTKGANSYNTVIRPLGRRQEGRLRRELA